MRLSVILIGYNSWHYLERCLASLRFLLDNPLVEVIYVDNASTDDSATETRRLYPQVKVIENRKNAGIAIARNQGLRIATGEYLWLLDSDTEVSATSLAAMLAFMDANPEAGLCGCRMYGQDGSVQESCRPFPTVGGKLRAAGRILVAKWKGTAVRSEPGGYDLNASRPFEVDYVIGACQLIRRIAKEIAGLLDEHIFYGPEDADFCLRVKQSGYRVYYLPHISIYHAYQRASSHRIFSKITFLHLQGLIYYFWKRRVLADARFKDSKIQRFRFTQMKVISTRMKGGATRIPQIKSR
ncbi:MAG: glycosyltransferase family 2 protein [Tannerella sp.]|jgi:GT2 family glycosyltransferase|nr:glycosyltransferase family 2 protein [Tannerella sp.]